jgi:hypothetical protein
MAKRKADKIHYFSELDENVKQAVLAWEGKYIFTADVAGSGPDSVTQRYIVAMHNAKVKRTPHELTKALAAYNELKNTMTSGQTAI